MKLSLLALSISILCLGCSKKLDSTPYKRDVDRICHAIEHANAGGLPSQDQAIVVAQYLGSNLETDEGRSLSIKMSQSKLQKRASLLAEEAEKVGITNCTLANSLLN